MEIFGFFWIILRVAMFMVGCFLCLNMQEANNFIGGFFMLAGGVLLIGFSVKGIQVEK